MGHIWSEVQREASDHETKQVPHPGELKWELVNPVLHLLCAAATWRRKQSSKMQNGAELKLLGSAQSELEVVPDW